MCGQENTSGLCRTAMVYTKGYNGELYEKHIIGIRPEETTYQARRRVAKENGWKIENVVLKYLEM